MNDTDRELLELAARAAGIEVTGIDRAAWLNRASYGWNPLADDGDAFRLMVKLGIHVMHSKHKVRAGRKLVQDGPCEEDKRPDPLAATRRAIVRAAAEIGRNMK